MEKKAYVSGGQQKKRSLKICFNTILQNSNAQTSLKLKKPSRRVRIAREKYSNEKKTTFKKMSNMIIKIRKQE